METDLKFKGSRNYLHSTDFYTWFAGSICSDQQIVSKLVFKKLISNQCKVFWKPTIGDVVGFVELVNKSDNKCFKGTIVEIDKPVTEAYTFDEERIVDMASIDAASNTATVNFLCGTSTIEVVVALTKKLHHVLFCLKKGRWLVGQLNFSERLPITYKRLSIKTTRIMQNKFSVNDVVIDGKHIGTIQFIVGE